MAKESLRARLKNAFVEQDTMPAPLRKGKGLFITCMIIVAVLNFLVFYVVVNINSFILAFQEYTGKGQYIFSLVQFKTVFADIGKVMDGEIIPAFVNTMIYFWLNFLVILPLSYLVSYFLYKKLSFVFQHHSTPISLVSRLANSE